MRLASTNDAVTVLLNHCAHTIVGDVIDVAWKLVPNLLRVLPSTRGSRGGSACEPDTEAFHALLSEIPLLCVPRQLQLHYI